MSVIDSKYPNWFVDWFVGFAEGDGSFICDRNAKRLFFRIRQKDPKILYQIHDWLGFGSVSDDKDGYFSFTVSSKHHIKALIFIFNGKLVLNKTNNRFVIEWLDNYNHWFKDNITYAGQASFVGLNNAWLCGFTDADGSLGFKLTADKTRKTGYRLRVYWYIDQTGVTVKSDLDCFKSVLQHGFIETKKTSQNNFLPSVPNVSYRLTIMSLDGCQKMQRYFETYNPQTTSKKVRFIRWSRVLNWALDRTWSKYLLDIQHLIRLNKDL
jgi:hypothetical protein